MRLKSQTSLKFKQDGIDLIDESEGKDDEDHFVVEKYRHARQCSVEKDLRKGVTGIVKILSVLEKRDRDQQKRLDRLLGKFSIRWDGHEWIESKKKTIMKKVMSKESMLRKASFASLYPHGISNDVHDPIEDLRENMTEIEVEHFESAALAMFAITGNGGVVAGDEEKKEGEKKKVLGYDNGRRYQMYNVDGSVVPESFHESKEFKQQIVDANEPVKGNHLPLSLKQEDRHIKLLVAREIEVKTHRQEVRGVVFFFMFDICSSLGVFPK